MIDKPFTLAEGFCAVVIGGAGAIGSEICRMLSDLGATVHATATTELEAESFALAGRPNVTCDLLDITDAAQLADFATRCGQIDALVNCAGILRGEEEYELNTFRKVIEVNLTGTFATCLAFRSALSARKGAIVNIASIMGLVGRARVPAYCASKGAVLLLTQSLAHAWANEGIRVNAVAPGFVATAINTAAWQNPEEHDRIAARTALKRWGRAEEIATTAVFLLMPGARYVTGATYVADGGFTAN